MSEVFWWSCPACGDRMAQRATIGEVERDQKAHVRERHLAKVWRPSDLLISHWRTED